MIPINPCGRLVDFIRRPYQTDFQFFANNPLRVRVAWYPCLPSAPPIEFPTPFMSRQWNSDQWPQYTVGEVWAAPHPFLNTPAKPTATGAHQCGTAEEWLGLTYPPAGPEVEYNADGLPTCCGVLGSVGGISWGGTAIVSTTNRYSTYYGISYGGTALVRTAPHRVYSTGGLSWGGTAEVSSTAVVSSTGGISWGGTAEVTTTPPTPGPTCLTAATLSSGVGYPATQIPGVDQWYTFPVAVGLGLFLVQIVGGSDSSRITTVYSGTCAALVQLQQGMGNANIVSTTAGAPYQGYARVQSTVGGTYTIIFTQL